MTAMCRDVGTVGGLTPTPWDVRSLDLCELQTRKLTKLLNFHKWEDLAFKNLVLISLRK